MSNFYFGSDSRSVSSADDEDNLPYPEALPRSDFIAPSFDAPTYLSTLSNRHQTLEDLRSDLRERSQQLSKELLDLVNTNYEQFLSLGSDLKGGEEKTEDVRVGLLGFRRGVVDVRSKVRERSLEVEKLLKEKTQVTTQVGVGRKLLEIDARLEELEERLMVESSGRNGNAGSDEDWSDSEEEEDLEEDAYKARAGGMSVKKLQQLVDDYRLVDYISKSVGLHHPFIIAQEARMMRVRNTIMLDLSTSLKQAHAAGPAASSSLLTIMEIFGDIDEGQEAIKILKSTGKA
jgi:hypothetical protein